MTSDKMPFFWVAEDVRRSDTALLRNSEFRRRNYGVLLTGLLAMARGDYNLGDPGWATSAEFGHRDSKTQPKFRLGDMPSVLDFRSNLDVKFTGFNAAPFSHQDNRFKRRLKDFLTTDPEGRDYLHPVYRVLDIAARLHVYLHLGLPLEPARPQAKGKGPVIAWGLSARQRRRDWARGWEKHTFSISNYHFILGNQRKEKQ